jgi:hypothetical protein
MYAKITWENLSRKSNYCTFLVGFYIKPEARGNKWFTTTQKKVRYVSGLQELQPTHTCSDTITKVYTTVCYSHTIYLLSLTILHNSLQLFPYCTCLTHKIYNTRFWQVLLWLELQTWTTHRSKPYLWLIYSSGYNFLSWLIVLSCSPRNLYRLCVEVLVMWWIL